MQFRGLKTTNSSSAEEQQLKSNSVVREKGGIPSFSWSVRKPDN
jgi:hypothetical protein